MNKEHLGHGTVRSYLTGFILSISLTLLVFFLVNLHISSGHITISHELLTGAIIVLALAQLVVQLIFFLYLAGRGSSARWNLVVFLSTASIVLIIVIGSIWIMNHLNYNMMSGSNMNVYMQNEEGIHK